MNCIIIDSTAEELALAVVKGNERYIHIGDTGARRHTSEILVELDKLLFESGLLPKDAEYIGVVVGPGSFTGIRIGVATANAMAKAIGAEVVEITALEVLVRNEKYALGLIDCKHGNYYALYKDGAKTEYKAITQAEADEYRGTKVIYSKPDVEGEIEVALAKIASGDTVATAKPFYIKQSSAEIESKNE